MNILLIGSGGREHAIAWKLAQSPSLTRLYAAPGNPGIAAHAECVALDATDHDAVLRFCHAQAIGLVVIGPEGPLVDGLGDSLRAAGLPVFGPSRAAAQLEGSKGFTKDLCAAHGIPTAAYVRVTGAEAALAAIGRFGAPVVIKADGLAAGKGVVVAMTAAEARDAAGHVTGEAVIEEFMAGEEVSLFALSDGETVVAFASAQDHKRVGDGDTGPNTGGMGAYSPATILTPEIEERAMREIVRPTVAAMKEAGAPFIGVLYAGLMLTAEGPKLVEYNARFGDPEAQAIMPRFRGDLALLMLAVATGKLAQVEPLEFAPEAAVTVVLAANGYPGGPTLGGAIRIGETGDAIIFHAGTSSSHGKLVASGGRVLAVTALGTSVKEACRRAYVAVDAVDFPTGFCRRDIGWREIAREAGQSPEEAERGRQ